MIRSVFSNWFAMIVLGVVSFVLTPVLIRHLGDREYGLWILAASLLEYYSLLDLGFKTTVQRYVADCNARRDRVGLDEIMSTSLTIAAITLGVLAGLSVGVARILPDFLALTGSAASVFARVILILGFSVALTYPARILSAHLAGLQRFELSNLVALATTAIRSSALVLVLVLGYGLTACSIVALASSIVSLLLHWKAVRQADPDLVLAWRLVSLARMRELTHYSFYVFLSTVGGFLRFYTDSIVIARFLAVGMIAPFSVAARLMEYFSAVLFGISQPLMSRLSELATRARREEMHALFLRATRLTMLLSLFIGSLFWLHGRTLLQLWVGERFVTSYPLLLTLAVGYVVALAQSPSIPLLMAAVKHRALGWWTLGEGVANLVLSVYWVQHYGLIGVALGTAVPMIVVKTCIQPWYTLRAVGMTWRTYLNGAFVRPMTAAVVFAAVSRLVSEPGHVGTLASLITEMTWQSVLFAGLAYAVGLTPEDREWTKACLDPWSGVTRRPPRAPKVVGREIT